MDEAALLPYREYHARRDREIRQKREVARAVSEDGELCYQRELADP